MPYTLAKLSRTLDRGQEEDDWIITVTHPDYEGMHAETDTYGTEEDAASAAQALEDKINANPAEFFEE